MINLFKMMKQLVFRYTIGLLLLLGIITGCTSQKEIVLESEVPLKWAEMTNYITKYTPANSPTFASRAYGYIALAMYESVVHGSLVHNSMAGQLNGLDRLPEPAPNMEYSWILSMNAAQSQIIKSVYLQTSDENIAKIDSLEHSLLEQFSESLSEEVVDRSVDYGRKVANAIFEWSKTDGGHRGYLKNFDKEMEYREFPGSWKPPLYAQSVSHHPLHPYWGKNRTFLQENREIAAPRIIAYDTVPGSPYYEQFLAVYKKEQELTQAEKEAALWWGDDPADTFTPPGHSYYIASIIVAEKSENIYDSAEAFAKTAMAVADAFIKCWEWKYHFFSERPNTFIPQYIDHEWESFWPDPPFPSFPSGHAIQAAASATVLQETFGNNITFTDRAHEGRERDELRDTDFVVRTFHTIWDFAEETANSRFYGGIHTPQDNEVGAANGKKIAQNVLGLDWKNND